MYVKLSSGAVDQFPYTVGDLRRDNPNTSFPKNPTNDMLADWDVYPVTHLAQPDFNEATQKIVRDATPSLNGSSWELGWTVSDKTSQEIEEYNNNAAQMNRNIRDAKLAETDFYALSDVTMSAAMTTYRQALRDITSHANWPHLSDSDWTTKP
jgi:hypothetical protein